MLDEGYRWLVAVLTSEGCEECESTKQNERYFGAGRNKSYREACEGLRCDRHQVLPQGALAILERRAEGSGAASFIRHTVNEMRRAREAFYRVRAAYRSIYPPPIFGAAPDPDTLHHEGGYFNDEDDARGGIFGSRLPRVP